MAGVPVERVAVLMGHRSSAITLKQYSAWVRERQQQLEADIRRIWTEKYRADSPEDRVKEPESAIQSLYGNGPKWIN
jgi:hypothetical protein